MKFDALPVESVLAFTGGDLPGLPQLRRQIEDEGEIGNQALRSGLITGPN
jgi:hypothetical protein